MNICIIYESRYGNGKQAMTYLEENLRKKGYSIQLMSIHEASPLSLPDSDLYVFSAPNRFGKIIRSMKKFLEKAEIKNSTAQYILVNTCLNPASSQDKGLEQMEEILRHKNISKLSEGIKLKVTVIRGPLEAGYEKKLDALTEIIHSSLKT
ncbi:MAG TPA: flavodoxin domain-containing protein [Candidatus Thermoplasmatota archaeon]|nr:flavodoxin domain-containing protein [Candidatus Thermoplasmatota archaeon]